MYLFLKKIMFFFYNNIQIIDFINIDYKPKKILHLYIILVKVLTISYVLINFCFKKYKTTI